MPAHRPQKEALSRRQREQLDDDWPIDPGRPLGLRLLALLGAFSFVMLGLSSLTPLLHPPERQVPPQPVRPADGIG